MPPATKVFEGIASQGPFQEYLSQPLQPRPIDAPRQPFTGQESTPVAIGDIALDFLKGIRTNRVANFMEQERNNQMGLDQFRAYVSDKLQNPDLTDEGRQKITDAANDVINRHMHFELRDAPKEGVGGFFKNLLTNLSGGPIKTREPINWAEARGQISQAAAGYSQSANLQKGVQKAMETIRQMRAAGAMPSEIQQAISNVAAEVGTTAPAHTKTFWEIVGPAASVDPYAERLMKLRLGMLNRIGGGGSIPSTAAPPEGSPDDLRAMIAMGRGEPQVESMPAASGEGGILDELRGTPAFIREDVFGKPEYTNLHSPAGGSQAAVRYPRIGTGWLNPNTLTRYPDAMQTWATSSSASPGTYHETNYDFRSNTNPKEVISERLRIGPTGEYEVVPIMGVPPRDLRQYTRIGPTQVPVAAGPTGVIVPRPESYYQTTPMPRETPQDAERARIWREGGILAGKALAVPGNATDLNRQLQWIANATESPEIRQAAAAQLRSPRPPTPMEQFGQFIGATPGGVVVPQTAPPPPAPGGANPVVAPATGARKLRRLQPQ